MGVGHYRSQPAAVQGQRGTEPLRGLSAVELLVEGGGDDGAVWCCPLHPAAGRWEEHWPANTVTDGGAVLVDVVGRTVPADVSDERDLAVVGTERCTRERDASPGGGERVADRVSPASAVAAVVYLVEYDEGPAAADVMTHELGLSRDLGVRDAHAVESGGKCAIGVRPSGIKVDSCRSDRICPLALESFGGHDDDDQGDLAGTEQAAGRDTREPGLARARRGHDQEVIGVVGVVGVERFLLPGAKGLGATPLQIGGTAGQVARGARGNAVYDVCLATCRRGQIVIAVPPGFEGRAAAAALASLGEVHRGALGGVEQTSVGPTRMLVGHLCSPTGERMIGIRRPPAATGGRPVSGIDPKGIRRRQP